MKRERLFGRSVAELTRSFGRLPKKLRNWKLYARNGPRRRKRLCILCRGCCMPSKKI